MISSQKKLKLRKNRDFFSVAKRLYSYPFVVFFRVNDKENSEFSVVIPKNKINKATLRNKLKRKIYQKIEKNLSKITNKQVVFVLNEKMTSDDVDKIIEKSLLKIEKNL